MEAGGGGGGGGRVTPTCIFICLVNETVKSLLACGNLYLLNNNGS